MACHEQCMRRVEIVPGSLYVELLIHVCTVFRHRDIADMTRFRSRKCIGSYADDMCRMFWTRSAVYAAMRREASHFMRDVMKSAIVQTICNLR
jgi:hypothetical protein